MNIYKTILEGANNPTKKEIKESLLDEKIAYFSARINQTTKKTLARKYMRKLNELKKNKNTKQ